MNRLNEQKLQALIRENKPVVVAVGDGSGLSFRITKTDASWQLRYRHGARSHWLTIGKCPGCSLKEAQKRATKERARIGEGIDPIAEKRRAKAALKAAKTFGELVQDYEDRALPDLAENSQKDYRRYLKNDLLPRLGDLRIEEIDGGVVVNLVEAIGKRSPVVARRAFTILSVIFSHGMAKHLATRNPCLGIKLKAILGKKKVVREGVSLSEDQLRTVLSKLPAIGRTHALTFKIILATCVRKGEMRLAKREHLDLESGIWHIPAENSKNAKAIDIPLAPTVIDWFRELLEMGNGWVLPGLSRQEPISANTLNAALLRLGKDVPHFTVHDLRRTARTQLGRLGVDVITAEKCLNHSLGGLVDVYDRGDYFEERRKALQIWADFLVACEQPKTDNVVAMRKTG